MNNLESLKAQHEKLLDSIEHLNQESAKLCAEMAELGKEPAEFLPTGRPLVYVRNRDDSEWYPLY